MAQPAKLYYINIIDIGTENDVEIRRYPLLDPVMVESNRQPWPIIEKEVVSVKSLFKRLLPQKDQPARDSEGAIRRIRKRVKSQWISAQERNGAERETGERPTSSFKYISSFSSTIPKARESPPIRKRTFTGIR